MRNRGILVVAALILVAAASVALAVVGYLGRLPEPEQADAGGLFRWLVTRDLAQESADMRLRLVKRFEQVLHNGIDAPAVVSELTSQQRQMLMANSDLLAEIWFLREVDRYFGEPTDRRPEFLARQIDEIRTAGIVEQLLALETPDGEAPVHGTALFAAFFVRIEPWTERAPPELRRRIGEFLFAVQQQMVADQWRVLSGG